tara:strand:+ start:365 stop:553 length:189 start_codon:yes stop_codon:yes gene_type:complete
LDKTSEITNEIFRNRSQERHLRKMRNRLSDEFDKIWVRYNQNKATYNQWINALDKWLKVERI